MNKNKIIIIFIMSIVIQFANHNAYADKFVVNNNIGHNFLALRIKPLHSTQWFELGKINLGTNQYNIPTQLQHSGLLEIKNPDYTWQVVAYDINPNTPNTFDITPSTTNNSTDELEYNELNAKNSDNFIVNGIIKSSPIANKYLEYAWPATCEGGGVAYVHIQCNIDSDSGTLYLYGNSGGFGGFGSTGTFYSSSNVSQLINSGTSTMTFSASAASAYTPGSLYINVYEDDAVFVGTGGGIGVGVGSAFFSL